MNIHKNSLKLLKLKRSRNNTKNYKVFLHDYVIIALSFLLLIAPIAYMYIYAVIFFS